MKEFELVLQQLIDAEIKLRELRDKNMALNDMNQGLERDVRLVRSLYEVLKTECKCKKNEK